MNIKLRIRELLLEGAHKTTKYGCLMVFLDINKSQWKLLQDNIDKSDLYEPKDEVGYGLETEPHVTILYGLHNDIDMDLFEEKIKEIKNVDIKLGKVSSFNNEKFDVIKFDIISKDLHNLNKVFSEFPNSNKFPEYKPHCTISYCNPGTSEKYIKKLNDYLKDNEITIDLDKIVYSSPDGSKKNYQIDKK